MNRQTDDELLANGESSPLAENQIAATRARDLPIAFYGARGSFTEQAARKVFGATGARLEAYATFALTFEAVKTGVAASAVLPFENTLAGKIQATHELLAASDLRIVADVVLRISLYLIGCAQISLNQLTHVHTHPAAARQCTRFLAARAHLKLITACDTAGSVAEVMQLNHHAHAAIASREAAQVYGGVIILRNEIQDCPENYTRFVVLQRSSTKLGV